MMITIIATKPAIMPMADMLWTACEENALLSLLFFNLSLLFPLLVSAVVIIFFDDVFKTFMSHFGLKSSSCWCSCAAKNLIYHNNPAAITR